MLLVELDRYLDPACRVSWQRRHVGQVACRCDVTGVTYATGADVTAVTFTVVVAIAEGAGLVGSTVQVGSVGQVDSVGQVGSAGHYITASFEGDSWSRLNLESTSPIYKKTNI